MENWLAYPINDITEVGDYLFYGWIDVEPTSKPKTQLIRVIKTRNGLLFMTDAEILSQQNLVGWYHCVIVPEILKLRATNVPKRGK